MSDQKNMANSSISTSDIEQMVRAANDLKQAFKEVNSELNKMNHALGKTTHSDNGDTNINVNVKGSGGSSRSGRSGRTPQQKKGMDLLDMLGKASGSGGGLAKFIKLFSTGWAGAALAAWTALFMIVRKMAQLGKRLVNTYSQGQKDLAALGQTSKNLNTVLGKDVKTANQFNSKMKAVGTAMGATWNVILGGIEKFANKLLDLIPGLDKLEKAVSGVARRQSIASTSLNLIGEGMKYGAANTTASNVEAAAVAYLMKAYGINETEARNSNDYAATVQAMAGLITSGGVNGMFNTSNVEGYGYSNGIWTPGVQYTDQYMAAMRSQMLADALDIYKEGGAEGLADWNNQLSKIQLLVSNMAGSLYSFDEVEQVSAVNLEDLDTTVSNMGTADDITSNDDDNTNREIDAYADITNDGAAKIENALNAAVEAIANIETEANAQLQGDLVTATEALEAALGLVAQEEKEGSTAVANGALAAAQSLANAANAAMTASANAITAEERAGYSTLASQLVSCSNSIIAAINASGATQIAIQQQGSGLRIGSQSSLDLAAVREISQFSTSGSTTSSRAGLHTGTQSSSAIAAAREIGQFSASGSALNTSAMWEAYNSYAKYIQNHASLNTDTNQAMLANLKAGLGSLTTQTQIDQATEKINKGLAEAKSGYNSLVMNSIANSVDFSGDTLGAKILRGGTAAVGTLLSTLLGGLGLQGASSLVPSFGGAYARGGIGLSEVRGATLFEDGPEAVLPLNDAGADFMAYTMQKALTQLGDVSTVNHGNTYNINGVKYLDQAVLDKMLLDDHDRTAQLINRRGY